MGEGNDPNKNLAGEDLSGDEDNRVEEEHGEGTHTQETDGSGDPDGNSNYRRLQSSDVDTEALETTRKESREVLTEQLRILRGVDDKALRTVRISVLVIGLGVSAVQISGLPEGGGSLSRSTVFWGSLGAAFLLVSIVVGALTYSASDPNLGISDDHRKDVVDGEYSEREWLALQLDLYDEWTGEMRETINLNVVGLNLTLLTSLSGVFTLLIAGVSEFDVAARNTVPPFVLAFIISIILFSTLTYRTL